MTLKQKLDNADFTDSNFGANIAFAALRLRVVCERVLFASVNGMRVGRDDSIDLAVRVREVAKAMGIAEIGNTDSIRALHNELREMASLPPVESERS